METGGGQPPGYSRRSEQARCPVPDGIQTLPWNEVHHFFQDQRKSRMVGRDGYPYSKEPHLYRSSRTGQRDHAELQGSQAYYQG